MLSSLLKFLRDVTPDIPDGTPVYGKTTINHSPFGTSWLPGRELKGFPRVNFGVLGNEGVTSINIAKIPLGTTTTLTTQAPWGLVIRNDNLDTRYDVSLYPEFRALGNSINSTPGQVLFLTDSQKSNILRFKGVPTGGTNSTARKHKTGLYYGGFMGTTTNVHGANHPNSSGNLLVFEGASEPSEAVVLISESQTRTGATLSLISAITPSGVSPSNDTVARADGIGAIVFSTTNVGAENVSGGFRPNTGLRFFSGVSAYGSLVVGSEDIDLDIKLTNADQVSPKLDLRMPSSGLGLASTAARKIIGGNLQLVDGGGNEYFSNSNYQGQILVTDGGETFLGWDVGLKADGQYSPLANAWYHKPASLSSLTVKSRSSHTYLLSLVNSKTDTLSASHVVFRVAKSTGNIQASGVYNPTGDTWQAFGTATPSRNASGLNSSTVTTQQLADLVHTLISELKTKKILE